MNDLKHTDSRSFQAELDELRREAMLEEAMALAAIIFVVFLTGVVLHYADAIEAFNFAEFFGLCK